MAFGLFIENKLAVGVAKQLRKRLSNFRSADDETRMKMDVERAIFLQSRVRQRLREIEKVFRTHNIKSAIQMDISKAVEHLSAKQR